MYIVSVLFCVFFFKQKTAYEMRISDWSSDVCSSDLDRLAEVVDLPSALRGGRRIEIVVDVGERRWVGIVAIQPHSDGDPVLRVTGTTDKGFVDPDRKSTRLNSSH